MAGFSVAPFVTTIDKSIVQNASGAATMKASIKSSIRDILTRPHRFVWRYEFALIFGLYSATYQSANLIDTFYDKYAEFPINKDVGKFLGVSAVNMTLCIYKDRCFARHFGVIKPTAVPIKSLGLWAIRDLMTILASFTVPQHGGKYLHTHYQQYFDSELKAFTFCQLLSPIFIQLFSTPLHLTGLDIYNKPSNTVALRMAFVRREYVKSLLARMARIFPAFSLGGLGNKFYHDLICDAVVHQPLQFIED
eukprot:CAMPEP_0197076602 /NCGR_PEP_ID=MMETSP1384-20130603/212200_1 /TAXON_ID=29189 /ORGANISM="Ammonia sp." /LENGTH=249 /DNA_ID=CAMNT_0042515461 /DNA_START=44 /DNA_END=793 /DNA_ORIENTATION=-